MKLTEKAKTLLSRYEAELERQLPLFKAKDIIRERHSIFMDMLEEDLEPGQEEISEQTVEKLLKETGAPAIVAAEYRTHKYLIGPGLFPLFSMVCKVVFSVLIIMACIGGIVFPETMAADGIPGYIARVVNILISVFGAMCFAFFILQRFKSEENLEEGWQPSHLSPVEHQEYPGTTWLMIYMAFLLVVAIFINIFLKNVALYNTDNGAGYWIPIELTHFDKLVPWFTALLAVRFVHTGILLYFKVWNALTKVTDIVLHFISAVFPLLLFIWEAKLDIPSTYNGPVGTTIKNLLVIFSQLGRVAFVVIMGALIISGLYKIYKLARKST